MTAWQAADIERAIAADVIGQHRRRRPQVTRQPTEEALARQHAIRWRFVELEGRIRMVELAAAFDVSVSQARKVLRGQQVGQGRYDPLQDDGLQPVIDQLGERRRRRT